MKARWASARTRPIVSPRCRLALRLRAEPLAAKTTAEVQTLLKFTEYRPTLEARAVVHVQDRPIYRVEMLLPDDLKVRQVSAPGEFQWALTERKEHPLLTVYFTAGQSGDVPVVVQGTLGGAGKIASLPLPAIEVCGVAAAVGRHRRAGRSGLRRRGPAVAAIARKRSWSRSPRG